MDKMKWLMVTFVLLSLGCLVGQSEAVAQSKCPSETLSVDAPISVIIVGGCSGNITVMDSQSVNEGKPRVLFHYESCTACGGFFEKFGKVKTAKKKTQTSVVQIHMSNRWGPDVWELRIRGRTVKFVQ
jgi:hypothetical protein